MDRVHFSYMWSRVLEPTSRGDQIEDRTIVWGKSRSRKTTGQIIKKDLEVNGLSLDLIHEGYYGVI